MGDSKWIFLIAVKTLDIKQFQRTTSFGINWNFVHKKAKGVNFSARLKKKVSFYVSFVKC